MNVETNMIITSQLFESYLECPTKCWLRSRAEPVTRNPYAEWARTQKDTYLSDGLKRLLPKFSGSACTTAPPIPKNAKDVTWRFATDVRWATTNLEGSLHAIERLPARGRGKTAQFIPIASNSPINLRRNTSYYSRSTH